MNVIISGPIYQPIFSMYFSIVWVNLFCYHNKIQDLLAWTREIYFLIILDARSSRSRFQTIWLQFSLRSCLSSLWQSSLVLYQWLILGWNFHLSFGGRMFQIHIDIRIWIQGDLPHVSWEEKIFFFLSYHWSLFMPCMWEALLPLPRVTGGIWV